MKTAVTVTNMLVRLTGLILIVLGVLFWVGVARSLIPVHMVVGIVLVLALWVLAGLAGRAGAGVGLVAASLIWGLIVLVFGFAQEQLLPGPAHWVIQVLHLLVGLAAIGLGEALAARTTRALRPARRPPVGGHREPRRAPATTEAAWPRREGNGNSPTVNYRPHRDESSSDEIH